MPRGRLITFEGGEGAGKSTQTARLHDRLQQAGVRAMRVREPGGTPGAEALRDLLLDGSVELSVRAETFLHFAARADHVDRVIQPALASGVWVVCDRFSDSTLVYQGFGQGADTGFIHVLSEQIGLMPDLTVILDVDVPTSLGRLDRRGRAADRYERLGPDFMRRVRDGFRQLAATEPTRCVLIAAEGERDAVADIVWETVRTRLPTDP